MGRTYSLVPQVLLAVSVSCLLTTTFAGTTLAVSLVSGQVPIAGCPLMIQVSVTTNTTTTTKPWSKLTVYVIPKGVKTFPGASTTKVGVYTFLSLPQPWNEEFTIPSTLGAGQEYRVGVVLDPGSIKQTSRSFTINKDKLSVQLYPGGSTLFRNLLTTVDIFSAAGLLDETVDLGYSARLLDSAGKVVTIDKRHVETSSMLPTLYYRTLQLPASFKLGTYTLKVSGIDSNQCHAGLSASQQVTVSAKLPYVINVILTAVEPDLPFNVQCEISGLPAYPSNTSYQVSLCLAKDARECLDDPYSPLHSPLGQVYKFGPDSLAGSYKCRLFLFNKWSSRVSYDDPHVPGPSYIKLAESQAFSLKFPLS